MRTTTLILGVLALAPGALAIDPIPAGPNLYGGDLALQAFKAGEDDRMARLLTMITSSFDRSKKLADLNKAVNQWAANARAHTTQKNIQRAKAIRAFARKGKRKDVTELPAVYETWLDSDDAQWAWLGHLDKGRKVFRDTKWLQSQHDRNKATNLPLVVAWRTYLTDRARRIEAALQKAERLRQSGHLAAFEAQVKQINDENGKTHRDFSKYLTKWEAEWVKFLESNGKRSAGWMVALGQMPAPKTKLGWLKLKLAWGAFYKGVVGHYNETVETMLVERDLYQNRAFLAGCPMLKSSKLDLATLHASIRETYVIPWQKEIVLRKKTAAAMRPGKRK